MVQKDKVQTIIDRLDDVMHSLRFQCSGADIHTVGNIRHTASLLKDQIETDPECVDEELVMQIVRNVEHSLVEFFKKKYSY